MTRPEARRATSEDLDALVELRAEMFAAMGVPERSRAWRASAREWFEARLDSTQHCVVVVEVEGEVVSCALGSVRDAAPSPSVPDGGDVLVSNVCTRSGARGRGHGRAAFEAVMAWVASTGLGRAELMATADGDAMYRQAGFTPVAFPAMRALLSG